MFADRGLVSAYHSFHGLTHGQERHATYFHLSKADQPWHIDFCFVPEGWAASITRAEVLDGDGWARRSDHRPLVVEVVIPGLSNTTPGHST